MLREVFLFDAPLSILAAKLRQETQTEITRLHRAGRAQTSTLSPPAPVWQRLILSSASFKRAVAVKSWWVLFPFILKGL
ncbi:hypothetical protein EEB11_18080 [Pseudotabrizicola sediminis]|uniref:Uncharacterized protein n=1 Tax=Pseudotabrizicola sediminis TaxID=2486418 RepID=A0ABY2KH28_9RHOB|nr:hypothetical protein EEB11_18080 [Pseudotabrizicola sediminis]